MFVYVYTVLYDWQFGLVTDSVIGYINK